MLRPIYLFMWVILFMPLAATTSFLPKKYRQHGAQFISKMLANIFNLKIKVTGEISKDEPILFVSNHISYLDILVLGASLPGSFVSKAEIAKWPIIGRMAKFGGTVFIDRRKAEAGNHLQQIENALFKDNKNLILFPEGTTSDGRSILPFKSSLFKIAENLAEGHKITIQPVTISYTHINGLPVQANERRKIAWVGDTEFTPHFKEFVNLGIVRVKVTVHPPIRHYANRKELALEAQKVVDSGLN